ncbi:phytanoyl-CoA dioxygenase family protein [Oleiagrimonas soli]|uniref:Phytanoyl-CoA dioxygenase n=1 Tax=Oleiagrimonas soli TaxID=1543381 RepID=A0A099CVP0_9GAMM|nr:phytanoyl-CoA dioxygenase family protein [Oleiagrimonas soli]KGI77080.1 hypothetical protein LF63_0112595 [Oleiagrimonas soli]MBB6185385.1 hypothetical protein [Oleiagrimonas soli]
MSDLLPASTETGTLGVPHLKRMWAAAHAARSGAQSARPNEGRLDHQVLNALGLGLQQTWAYLMHTAPTFERFEHWIVDTAGAPDPLDRERLRATIHRQPLSDTVRARLDAIEASPPVLDETDLAHWHEHGYVVLHDAITESEREAAEQAVYAHVHADPNDRESWYRGDGRHGIMVELIQHAALNAARHSPRIHKAFAQLWDTADLWPTADRCGFHPPQRAGYPFPGPDLHWDLDLGAPLEFDTQGILYLTDTPAEQGALTVVPGFQRKLPDWLAALEPGLDPQDQDLHALGSEPVAGRAGDLVIWHAWLPHGSRPNLGERPRLVQYINRSISVSA